MLQNLKNIRKRYRNSLVMNYTKTVELYENECVPLKKNLKDYPKRCV